MIDEDGTIGVVGPALSTGKAPGTRFAGSSPLRGVAGSAGAFGMGLADALACDLERTGVG